MSIKPIDMQVSVGQIHEVAKNEQGRSNAAAEIQQALDSESGVKSREVPTRVDENKKAEHAIITGEEKGSGRQRGGKQRGGTEDKKDRGGTVKDDRMGLFIDVLK